jgi:hypothetical protein
MSRLGECIIQDKADSLALVLLLSNQPAPVQMAHNFSYEKAINLKAHRLPRRESIAQKKPRKIAWLILGLF